jgi:putative redox protein
MTPAHTASDANEWVTARIGRTGFHVSLDARSHQLGSDEPVPFGGTDTGLTPYELLLSALGSCTAMTLRMYADRKGLPLERVEVRLRQSRAHEPDCETCATDVVGVDHIERHITLVGPLTDDMRKRLLEIADRCPVHQTLSRGIPIESRS